MPPVELRSLFDGFLALSVKSLIALTHFYKGFVNRGERLVSNRKPFFRLLISKQYAIMAVR